MSPAHRFCPASPTAPPRAAVQPSPASALCAGSLDALHLDEAAAECEAAAQHIPAAAAAAEECTAGCASADGAAVASRGGEPCTPQRHSGHDSSWNESPLGTSGLDYGEVQSPGAGRGQGGSGSWLRAWAACAAAWPGMAGGLGLACGRCRAARPTLILPPLPLCSAAAADCGGPGTCAAAPAPAAGD